MTAAELDELLRDSPVLYHMAARGSWPSIRRHGLLSTAALLDLFAVAPDRRAVIEAARRPAGVVLERPGLGRVEVRDQSPMSDAGLRRCLRDGLAPADWYRLLNGRVFFWLSRTRLLRLLNAGLYRAATHDVLELDATSLVTACRDRITLSAINSGTTVRAAPARGLDTFLPIADYPYAHWRARRPRGERVVELCVTDGVPDIERFVRRVVAMRADGIADAIWTAGDP